MSHLSLFFVVLLAAFALFGVRGAAGATASGGCTASAGAVSPYPANISTQGQLVAPDNRNRTFTVYVPPGYRSDRPSAVVLLFHGGFGTGQQAQQAYKMDETAEANNFIVVYPDGWRVSTLTSWNGGACCNPSVNLGVDDVGFVSALLDHLEASLCIDTSAVFAAGMSNGAIMSYRLACELSHRLAAIAPVEGTLEFSPCTPSRPVPVLAVHGLADLNIPFEGGFGCGPTSVNFTSVPASIDVMAAANGCSCHWQANGSCATTYLVEGHGSCLSYGPCEGAKVDVVLCSVEGNGHAWPGASDGVASAGCNNTAVADFHTNTHIWAFFNATRTTTTGGGGGGEVSSASSALLHAMWRSVHAWLFGTI